MIRQAHTYLVGAMGGATLIAIAIAVFVVLVSAQVFRDWPIAALGGNGDTAAVSTGQPAGAADVDPGGDSAKAASAATNAGGKRAGSGSRDETGSLAANGGLAGVPGGAQEGTAPAGSEAGGGQGGAPVPAGSPQAPTASSPGGGGSASAGGGSAGGGKSSGGSTESPPSSPTSQVTEAVNGTVAKVDEEALGGALGNSGVTGVTEGVVNGVAGPESVVGKAVEETAGAVGGLLHGGR